jgi:peptidyl-prolyl cis-trans isomerase D
MAVIGRIRKRVGLLIAFVGISMLLFILGDLVTSNKGIMGRNNDVIGIVGGEKIRYPEFEKKVEQMVENYKLNAQKDNVDQQTQDMLREQAWNGEVNNFTLGKEYKKLGIAVGNDELYDMCTGKNPHPQIKQAFTNKETGAFNPQDVVKFLKGLPDRDEKTQTQWKTFEDAIRDERVAEKYKSIIKGGMYVTSLEAMNYYKESGRSATIKAIRLGYETIPDSTVVVEDKDLRNYYNEHQNDYKQAETTRKIEYVSWDITPSDEDKKTAMDWIEKRKGEFESATDPMGFAAANTDGQVDTTFKAKGTLPPALDSVMFAVNEGAVIGPYQELNSYKLARLVKTKMVADSIKVSHALVAYKGAERAPATVTRTREEARAKADSLFKLAGNDKKFIEMASASDDAVASTKQGDLGWIQSTTGFDPKFKEAAFSTEKGNVTLVETNFGFHIIKVYDASKKNKQVQVAVIERKVEPSQKTYDALYNKAQEFVAKNGTGKSFDSAAVAVGMNKRVADNLKEADKQVPGLEQPRELVRWAYKANKDDVSKVFTLGEKYVVAHLTDIREKGISPMEDVKDRVTAGARKAKKAEQLMEKVKSKMGGGGTIDAVAQNLNTNVISADKVIFANNYIQGMGNEPHVLATVFTMKQGQISQPIKGDNGVYVVMLEKMDEPAELKDVAAEQKQIGDQRRQRSEYEVGQALKDKAKVEDYRGKFY